MPQRQTPTGPAVKFLFDRNFELEDDAWDHALASEDGAPPKPGTAGAAEEQPAPDPEPEPEPVAPTFSQAEMAKAREAGLAEGHAAGIKEATQSGEHQIATALNAIVGGIKELAETLVANRDAACADGVAVGGAVARKLFPALNAAHGLDEVERVVREVLERMTTEPRVAVRVAPDLREALAERLEHARAELGHRGEITIEADERIAPGDCRVEWGQGGAARDTVTLWRAVDEIIARHLGPAATPPDTAEDTAGETAHNTAPDTEADGVAADGDVADDDVAGDSIAGTTADDHAATDDNDRPA